MIKGKILLFFTAILAAAPFAGAEYVRPDKIVMLWDFIGSIRDNNRPGKKTTHDGLDVVSPTWFSIRNPRGDVASLADREYVRRAHDNGIKVWALFENRSNGPLTFRALSNTESRNRMVDQIASHASDLCLDGINIDFEALRANTGRYFELFIAELYAALQPMGIILSVDIPFPPGEIQGIYDIALIAGSSDYLVMMAYDQHHGASDTPGPVAAIGWVRQGIEDALVQVPHEKIILGIPFYTRIWTENRQGKASGTGSELRGMKDAYELFGQSPIIWERDGETEQIYAEFADGQIYHRAWLEDEHSLSLKLDAVIDYDLAGISAWRRGWEWEETWGLINAYFD